MIYLVGKGGHSVSVQEVLCEYGSERTKIISSEEMENLPFEEIENVKSKFFIAIGDISFRQRLVDCISLKTGKFKTITSRYAYISSSCALGQGTVVMPGAHIRYDASIGEHCIVNTGAVIEHECQIGNYVNISPNATLCGKVTVKNNVDIGAGVTVLPGINIKSGIIIGAGSTVVSDLLQPGIYIGSPAIKKD